VQTAKPCMMANRLVWKASKRGKATQGAAGVEEASLADGEEPRTHTLSKLWNRLASGRDLPPPGRTVALPKRGGGQRR
jgi:retron-type reverse transcriptase